MANTLQFDLVSPERKLASVQATEVQIPGTDGDMTAMEGHAATITTLRPGILKVIGPQGTQAFAVTGGFAEIGASAVTVLAERAIPTEWRGIRILNWHRPLQAYLSGLLAAGFELRHFDEPGGPGAGRTARALPEGCISFNLGGSLGVPRRFPGSIPAQLRQSL